MPGHGIGADNREQWHHEGNLSDTGSLETWATNDGFSSHACSAADSWSAEEEELTAEDLECW